MLHSWKQAGYPHYGSLNNIIMRSCFGAGGCGFSEGGRLRYRNASSAQALISGWSLLKQRSILGQNRIVRVGMDFEHTPATVRGSLDFGLRWPHSWGGAR